MSSCHKIDSFQIFRKRLDYNDSAAPKFKSVHFDFFLLSLYQISNQ
jgi:hypothetical protein